jgi:hypothetical protein
VLGIAIAAVLLSLGFVAATYSVDVSHMARFFRYSWMVLYFLFAMAAMLTADFALKFATLGWWPQSRVGRYSNVAASWTLSALVVWIAFWYQSVFALWIVFVLALLVLCGFFSGIIPRRFSEPTH